MSESGRDDDDRSSDGVLHAGFGRTRDRQPHRAPGRQDAEHHTGHGPAVVESRGVPHGFQAGRHEADELADTQIGSDRDDEQAERPVAVYRLYDPAGALLYVGATVEPERRLKNHRRRFGAVLDPASMTLEWYSSRTEADVAEGIAITTEHPRENHDGIARPYRPHGVPSFPPNPRPVYVPPPPDRRDSSAESDLTVEDLVKLLGVRSETIRRYLGSGAFPGAYRMTPGPKGAWRIPRSGVIAWRNERRQGGQNRES